jgi:hypothetical protein
LLLFFFFIFLNLIFIEFEETKLELHSLNGPNILYRQLLLFYALIIVFKLDKYFILSSFILFLIFLIGSRAGFLIFLIMFIINLTQRKTILVNKITFLIAIIFILNFIYLNFSSGVLNTSFNTRYDLYLDSLLSFNNPNIFYSANHLYPHNIFLEILIFSGYIGLFFSIIFFYLYLKLSCKNINYFLIVTPFFLGSFFSGDIFDNLNILYILASAHHK